MIKGRKHSFIVAASLSIFLLAGCVSLKSDAPPPAIYRIDARTMTDAPPLTLDKTTVLIVSEPEVPAGFSGRNITLYFDSGRRQDYYAGAQWADDISALVWQFMVNSARESFPDLIVDRPGAGLEKQYGLDIEIIDFQPEYKGDPAGLPELHTQLRFTLKGGEPYGLLSDFILDRRGPAPQDNLTAITAGLEQQLQSITREAFERLAQKMR